MGKSNMSAQLWSDEPTRLDLLSFDAVAKTVVQAVLDDALDPVTIGVSGAWGSGKTTVLRLIEDELAPKPPATDTTVLVISTDPWRYDPGVGAKETLIGEVLSAVAVELAKKEQPEGRISRARTMLTKLRQRVDWAKALQVAAKTSLTLQMPSVDDLTSLINTEPSNDDADVGDPSSRGLGEFRSEFRTLMESAELSHLRRVVVLVDDLDRCLPDTVVDTLETIRLFLAVPKMAFVVAADEHRVADALRARFPDPGSGQQAAQERYFEEPASLYLHKIVQTTVPLPTLSRFDTEAFLVLLQLSQRMVLEELTPYIEACVHLRLEKGLLDDLAEAVNGNDISAEMAFASRMTPILYEKLQGSPRRIKRFLNDLRVRQSVAGHRGIELEPDIVAKLMVLEKLLPNAFATVLGWLARGELRSRMAKLEITAGRPTLEPPIAADSAPEDAASPEQQRTSDEGESEPVNFDDELIRWAKLPPDLGPVDLAPYLYLAAAFTGEQLLDAGLPSRLRDIAANLLSSVRFDQRRVTEADITALGEDDALSLVEYLGRAGRDRPTEQTAAVRSLVRITTAYPASTERATRLLQSIPARELQPATILVLPSAVPVFRGVLEHWKSHVPAGQDQIGRTLDHALGTGSSR
ncbi:KAP P-loop domain-containing protein [Streptomyces sp. KO7888]|uniref:KAP family P-loop NTPase fold protein n=1 Tax=Streptomyces sp. KO7888 TaxID=2602737 RepID=UPI0013F5E77A|nr:P-loop NTPase fold protein [Streptomyces sp. KO7888]NHI05765.1 KAP P-loop domain-containing protein [Streptomyces sp. KO7888]